MYLRWGIYSGKFIEIERHDDIETYADIILLVYRPAQHGILSHVDGNNTQGKGEIIIAKNRGNEVGKIGFKHNKGMSRIVDADD